MSARGLILFAHGARDPEWALPFEDIRARVSSRRPDLAVALAYLDIMSPRLDAAVDRMVAEGAADITVAPLFMAQGGHLKTDVPRLLGDAQRRHPGLGLHLLAPVGEVEAVLSAIAAWLAASVPDDR